MFRCFPSTLLVCCHCSICVCCALIAPDCLQNKTCGLFASLVHFIWHMSFSCISVGSAFSTVSCSNDTCICFFKKFCKCRPLPAVRKTGPSRLLALHICVCISADVSCPSLYYNTAPMGNDELELRTAALRPPPPPQGHR
jgi:hypothetical protein